MPTATTTSEATGESLVSSIGVFASGLGVRERIRFGEQVDAITDADRKTDGKASADDDLIDRLAGASADETDRMLDEFVEDSADAESVQKEHDRQRALRNVRKHGGRSGLGAVDAAAPKTRAEHSAHRTPARPRHPGAGTGAREPTAGGLTRHGHEPPARGSWP